MADFLAAGCGKLKNSNDGERVRGWNKASHLLHRRVARDAAGSGILSRIAPSVREECWEGVSLGVPRVLGT